MRTRIVVVFPCTVGAEETEDLARADLERDILDAPGLAIALRQRRRLHDRLGNRQAHGCSFIC
jgi:hypothetical protein